MAKKSVSKTPGGDQETIFTQKTYQTGARKTWRLTRETARKFCDLISTAEKSLPKLLAEHPELPPLHVWLKWRKKNAWLATDWKIARELQAEHLAQNCLDIAATATSENAHAQRLKFDVMRQLAKWLCPAAFSDKTQQGPSVSVGIAIQAESLNELRTKLNATRDHYRQQLPDKTQPETLNGSETQNNPETQNKPETLNVVGSNSVLGTRTHAQSVTTNNQHLTQET